MYSKVCGKCLEQKPSSEFYRDRHRSDGITWSCKACSKAAHKAYVQTDAGKASIRRHLDSGKRRESTRRWEKTDSGKEIVRKIYCNKLASGKIAAHSAVRKALKTGRLHRKLICSECFCHGPTNFHHHKGYAKEHRLDVVELCAGCHSEEHRHHLSA